MFSKQYVERGAIVDVIPRFELYQIEAQFAGSGPRFLGYTRRAQAIFANICT